MSSKLKRSPKTYFAFPELKWTLLEVNQCTSLHLTSSSDLQEKTNRQLILSFATNIKAALAFSKTKTFDLKISEKKSISVLVQLLQLFEVYGCRYLWLNKLSLIEFRSFWISCSSLYLPSLTLVEF